MSTIHIRGNYFNALRVCIGEVSRGLNRIQICSEHNDGIAVATDGLRLIGVPIQHDFEVPVEPFMVDLDSIPKAPTKGDVELVCTFGDAAFPSVEVVIRAADGKIKFRGNAKVTTNLFPDWVKIVPSKSQSAFIKLALNPVLAGDVVKELAGKGGSACQILSPLKSGDGVLNIKIHKHQDVLFLLMPCKFDAITPADESA